MTRSPARIAALVAALVLAAGLWWLLAPVQLGGPTSYAVVSGQSMEPSIEKGDFVLARARSSYDVGDVVLFESKQLRRNVLHRIVEEVDGRFVTKGDNNDFLDGERITPAQVLGAKWLVVPGMGGAVEWLREPVHLGILLFVLVFLALAGGRQASRRRSYRVAAPPPASDGVAPVSSPLAEVGRGVLAASFVAFGLFALLGLASWWSPLETRVAAEGAWTHTGTFAYGADTARSPVYPSGTLTTGDPAFTTLVDRLDVTFTYDLASALPVTAEGSAQLEARMSDGQGWERTLRMGPPVAFDGPFAVARGRLELARIETLASQLRALTGSAVSTFTVDVVPRVRVDGRVGDARIAEEFSPTLPFTFDGVALRLADAERDGSLLEPSRDGTGSREVPTSIGAGGLAIDTRDARVVAVLGLVVSLLLAMVAWALTTRRRGVGAEDEAAGIARRYGGKIVDTAVPVAAGRWVTELGDIESLVRIADLYERVILHAIEDGRHVYVVDDGVAVYRYRVGSARLATTLLPAPGR